TFYFHCDGDTLDLHSFPTRRSSDLVPAVVLGEQPPPLVEVGGEWHVSLVRRPLDEEPITVEEERAGPPAEALLVERELLGVEVRSEERTSELQSQSNLVCRLLLEKK